MDTKSNLYITPKYKKINSKLKEKDKWIYYDEYGWENFQPRQEFNKEKQVVQIIIDYIYPTVIKNIQKKIIELLLSKMPIVIKIMSYKIQKKMIMII